MWQKVATVYPKDGVRRSRLLDLAAQEASLYCTDIVSGLPVPFCAICRAWTLYAFNTGSQLTAVQSFNLIVNDFFCYRQVDMAVGFGAIRRPVSEDLIVSCYYFIRKYTVINAVLTHCRQGHLNYLNVRSRGFKQF